MKYDPDSYLTTIEDKEPPMWKHIKGYITEVTGRNHNGGYYSNTNSKF